MHLYGDEPRLPKGKKLVDTVVSTDVDSLYKSVFENETFFEIVGAKTYEEFRNYSCTPWAHAQKGSMRQVRGNEANC